MNTRQRFDVVVVGAGPSGASAAYHLAVQGWRVLRTTPDGLTAMLPQLKLVLT